MDYIKPSEVAESFLTTATTKSQLPASQLLLRGFLSGAFLGFATTVAFTSNAQGVPPVIGSVLFPVGFAMIVILGLELVTGSFAMLPTAFLAGRVKLVRVLTNLFWVYLGNLIGGCLYAWMYAAVQTQFHHVPVTGAGALIVAAAQAKTLAYQKLGGAGLALSFLKGILCNWMVCMGVVMGLTSRSTLGKIVACWLPIFAFFALGYEHSVVNMFVIPAGILMGAPVSLRDWWLWNQIPVTVGNIVGGLLFVGLPMLWIGKAGQVRNAEVDSIQSV
ncbi:formate/nitrite transporter family protein [Granulicella arctica]|uniref:Formate/nitrite transporter n=1 Tax=Granulicella arctica TaxID=940613 RepID=A0A7Y9PL50_9BACT|nr:formate/nitrite transporter family protein [Granulicella arctica]NYF81111.1 formate/nitrite transporter [Granulicella arctica]